MKHRMERLMSIRPRKAGAVIAALLVAAAVFMGGVEAEAGQTVEIPAVEIPARKVPEWVTENLMSDEDYTFLMGLARADMDGMTLGGWRAYLEPNAKRIKEILDTCVMENAFMETLRIDAVDIINASLGMRDKHSASVWRWTGNAYRYGTEDVDSAIYAMCTARWLSDAFRSVGERNAMLADIRACMSEIMYSMAETDADAKKIEEAMDCELLRLEEKHADAGIGLRFGRGVVKVEPDATPWGDMPQTDYEYLLGFRTEGYRDMSLQEFNQALDAQRGRVLKAAQYYAPSPFIRTVQNSLIELYFSSKYDCTAHIVLTDEWWAYRRLDYTLSWNIPDPSQITVGLRDTAITNAQLRVEAEGRRAVAAGGTDDEISTRFAENVLRIMEELDGEGIDITISDMGVGV